MPRRWTIRLRRCVAALGLALTAPALAAEPAPFELPGPALRISVTRGGQTLPIAQTPALAEGDMLSIEAALPPDQGARLILGAAFLRGATNPPPKDWTHFAESWAKKDKDRRLTLTVPKGARQMVLFLVPDTGGAEGALTDAVRGKPGEFIRATQDLNQASLDRSRLDAFIAAIKAQENSHPEYLRTLAPTLARSLSIKLNDDCLSKVIEMQAACLLDNRESLVLADVHTSSMAETLTGAPTDLALQLSATREGGYGYYSPYIAVVRDVARIFGAFSNPDFGYLPTLSVRRADEMALLLNSAPSFAKPKSVMVIAMPAIEADSPPRLRKGEGGPVCLARPGAILPVEGAPLIYSTAYARDMAITVTAATGETVDLPLTPRADLGGYRLGDGATLPPAFKGSMRGHLHGRWGFDQFDGPYFDLQSPDGAGWRVAGDPPALVVGRDNDVRLTGGAPACVDRVTMRQGDATAQPVSWKSAGRDGLQLTLPLAGRKPGPITLEITYQGVGDPSVMTLDSYAEASRVDTVLLHAGDRAAILSGQRLDQVARVDVAGVGFRPDGLARDGATDRLKLAAEGDVPLPTAGQEATARIVLRDGRSLKRGFSVSSPRPQLALIGKSVTRDGASRWTIDGDAVLPSDGRIVFSTRLEGRDRLSATDAIEVAGDQDDAPVVLTVGKGLQIDSAGIVLGALDARPISATHFGPLRFRLRRGGDVSDWRPLVTLARLPQIESATCGPAPAGCVLRGRDLFLIDAISATPGFQQPTAVTPGFTGSTLTTPAALGDRLYVRLRDAPDQVVSLALN